MKTMRVLMLVLLAVVMAACSATPTVAPATNPPAPITTAPATAAPATSAPTVAVPTASLVLGSWRVDDADAWAKILAEFTKQYPTITVTFDPTNPTDYNATLQTQLTTGTGPDLFFVRSFDVGRGLYTGKYVASVSHWNSFCSTDCRRFERHFLQPGHLYCPGHCLAQDMGRSHGRGQEAKNRRHYTLREWA